MSSSKPLEDVRGKIAFIYPTKRDSNTKELPILNYFIESKNLGLVMCVAFLDLDRDENYLITLSLKSPSGIEILDASGNLNAIPSNEIDPKTGTSFLSVDVWLSIEESGTYQFKCGLINMEFNYGNPIDEKVISFNIVRSGANDE